MWLQISLTVDKSRAPLIELLFDNLGAAAVTLGDAGDEPMLEPGPGEMPLWQATRVTGLFTGTTNPDDLRGAINLALSTDVGRSMTLEHLEDRDWERSWLDLFQPMRFGDRLWICPGGSAIDQADAVIVDLDPGLAFGTGTHPTTALCLEWLDGQDVTGRHVIDFGCGSGILGIAALKLGAKSVVAVDHDPQALIATRDNAVRNNVGDRLRTVAGSDLEHTDADLVLANILANVLIDLSPRIGSLVRRGGKLALSGLLTEQAAGVVDAYQPGFTFAQPQTREDWALLQGTRQ